MNLRDYLASENALTVAQLASRLGVRDLNQVRQWQYGYAGRQPGPAYCVAIELATANQVRRWDLRPDDWDRIWPELVKVKGAPRIPQQKVA